MKKRFTPAEEVLLKDMFKTTERILVMRKVMSEDTPEDAPIGTASSLINFVHVKDTSPEEVKQQVIGMQMLWAKTEKEMTMLEQFVAKDEKTEEEKAEKNIKDSTK